MDTLERAESEESLPYRDSDGFDHDCVRCEVMADIDWDQKYPGERGTCCVCHGHECDEAIAERAKHPKREASQGEGAR
jgi:hypothetical protein